MPKRSTHVRGFTAAGVLLSTYRWSYPCKPKKVWRALTTDINEWWKKDFFGQASSTKFRLEPKLGGVMAETGPKGAGMIWGTVHAVDPGRSILLIGHTTPKWGGPSTATMEFTVEAAKDGSELSLTHAVFGNADEKTRRSYEQGWKALFDEAMRKYLE
jgi:uncharacterized protein YndB with AHSA1/START domain